MRHRIDEKSPLFGAVQDLESYEDTKTLLDAIYIHVSGVDELTGRGVGKSASLRFRTAPWCTRSTQNSRTSSFPKQVALAIRRGSVFKGMGRQRKVNVAMKKMTRQKQDKLAIYWSNFNGIDRGSSQADEQGKGGSASPPLTSSAADGSLQA